METFSALLALCVGNSPVTGEFPSQRPVTRSFDVFFDLRLNKRLGNNHEAGDLRRHRARYDVILMTRVKPSNCFSLYSPTGECVIWKFMELFLTFPFHHTFHWLLAFFLLWLISITSFLPVGQPLIAPDTVRVSFGTWYREGGAACFAVWCSTQAMSERSQGWFNVCA